MKKKKRIIMAGMRITLIIVVLAVSFGPILWTVLGSFKTAKDIIASPPKFIFTPTMENVYSIMGSSVNIPKYFMNSLIISVISTVLALVVASLAGYSLARIRPRGSTLISVFVITLRMLPPIVITIPLYLVYKEIGLQDTLIGLIIPYTALSIPLAVWMLRSFFSTLPRGLEEAAMLDGCGRLSCFHRIIMPLAMPGIAATSIFCFILSWNDFVLALPLTSTQATPLPIIAAQARAEEGLQWGKIGGIVAVMVIPVFFFTLLVQKHIVSGLAAGSMKE